MRRLPTVSEMPRATACPASVALPRHPDDGEQSAAALRGSRIHAYIAARLRKWPLPDIGKTKVSHIQLGKLRRYLGRGDVRCELAMSYDGDRVEVLGENIGRDYNRPGTLCGAADIVAINNGFIHLIDIKTGSLPVPPPQENWQLATLATLLGWAFIDSHCIVKGTVATLARDGSWSFDSHMWTIPQIEAIRRRIDDARAQWTEAHEAEESGWGATPTPGQHCRWCKAVCPHNEQASEAA